MTTEKKPYEMAVGITDRREALIIRKMSLISLIGNTVFSGFKLFAGVIGNSGAMISDAIHSFSDVLTTLIAWIGVKVSKKAADEAHPYGHERMECVASLLLGLVLMATGLGVGRVGVDNIIANNYEALAIPKMIALAASVVSILGKEAMFWYTRYYAKLINSSAFMADAWHHRSDALSSVGSFAGILGARLGFPALDPAASIIICLFIIKAAYGIFSEAIRKMTDHACDDEFVERLKEKIMSQNGVRGIDRIDTRLFGDKVYAEVEISVDGYMSLIEAHLIAHKVHDEVEAEFEEIKHCMVHVNPSESI